VISLLDEINGLIIARENTKIKLVSELLESNGNGRNVEIIPVICYIRFCLGEGSDKIV
jgi:hypothetical protein